MWIDSEVHRLCAECGRDIYPGERAVKPARTDGELDLLYCEEHGVAIEGEDPETPKV